MGKRTQGGDAGTARDTDDQRHIRDVVLEEVEQIFHKHGLGGVVLVGSKDSAAWRFVLPKWGGIVLEAPGVVRVRISSRTPALREIADSTMHYVATMRDMATDAAVLFETLFAQVEGRLGGPGSIAHRRASIIERKGD